MRATDWHQDAPAPAPAASRSRPSAIAAHRRVPVLIGAALGVIVLVTSCATFSEPYEISLVNDLNRPVTLSDCVSADCARRSDPWVLQPQQSGDVGVEIGGGYNGAIITEQNGTVVGCLPFQLSSRPKAGLDVKVSAALPCGVSGGTAATHGKDWPPQG